MNKKCWLYTFAGCLLVAAAGVVGLSWYQSTASEGTMNEWWSDLAAARDFDAFTTVVTGEKCRERLAARKLDLEFKLARVDEVVKAEIKAPDKSAPWPLFGGTPSRNMVNLTDKNVPTTWNVEEGKYKNVKWVAALGTATYSSPVIADGKVFIGTNNLTPRDPKMKDREKAVLMAFNEADGKFLWQLVHDMSAISEEKLFGMVSTPTVEGKRVYYTTPGCVVVCSDTDGKIQWTYDMATDLGVAPFHCAGSSPLVVGDLVMIVTGNGVSEGEKRAVIAPKAPSFAAFHKTTGKLAWQSNLPGDKIIEGQWSNPTLTTVNGKQQVIFPGGDGVLYSFEPETGKLIWKCDCNPIRKKKGERDRTIENYITGTPVVVGDRLYIGLGPMPEHDFKQLVSYFLCLDITKQGDVSPKNFDVKDAANKNSALVWAFGGPIQPPPAKGRQVHTGVFCATACVHDGLIYIPEESGYMHCLDAKTGQQYWEHDFKDLVWGSAYYVDGKVYVGLVGAEVVIFEAGKSRKIIATVSIEETTHGTPVVANGVLYINTKSKLYAIANGK